MYNRNNRPIALFGVGFRGERFFYINNKRENIKMCFDNNGYGEEFHGIPVLSPEPSILRKYFVIITIEDYRPIRNQLEEYDLKEFEDFIGWEFYDKKIALIHGNCYRRIWDKCLKSSKEFSRVYALYDNPEIHLNSQKIVRESALRHCDLLIAQDIQADNMYGYSLSFEYIRKQVPEICKIVVVPNLVGLGKGFFPQGKIKIDKKVKRDIFPEADVNIDRMVQGGADWIQIGEKLKENIYQKEYIISNFNLYIDKMLEREANWDIKIVDYILHNYKTEKIFFDTRHPTNTVLEEIIRRLLLFLGMSANFDHADDEISEEEMPVYPCVKEALGLEWDTKAIRNNNQHRLMPGTMDMIQYIKEYIFWNYGDIC